MAGAKLLLVTLLLLLNLTSAYVPKSQLPDCINHLDNYICGVNGQLPNANPDRLYKKVATLDACRIECLQRRSNDARERCFAFGYNQKAQTCSLFHRSLLSYRFEANESSPQVFYSGSCFDCLTTCPPKGRDNLLVNPDFDAPIRAGNPISPWGDGKFTFASPNNVTLVSPGFNSPSAWNCSGICSHAQTLSLCEGELYEVTFDYRLDTTVTNSQPGIQILAGDWEYSAKISRQDSGKWLPFFDTFVARKQNIEAYPTPFNAYRFDITLAGDQNTHVSVDNLAIRPARKLSATPGSISVVKNGGFETGQLSPWEDSGPKDVSSRRPKVASIGYNSNHSVTVTGGRDSDAENPVPIGQIQQRIALVPHAGYILSLTYKKIGKDCLVYQKFFSHGVDIQLSASPDFRDGGANSVSFSDLLYAPPALNQWITTERPFLNNANVAYLRFFIEQYDDCIVYLDDISIRAASF